MQVPRHTMGERGGERTRMQEMAWGRPPCFLAIWEAQDKPSLPIDISPRIRLQGFGSEELRRGGTCVDTNLGFGLQQSTPMARWCTLVAPGPCYPLLRARIHILFFSFLQSTHLQLAIALKLP